MFWIESEWVLFPEDGCRHSNESGTQRALVLSFSIVILGNGHSLGSTWHRSSWLCTQRCCAGTGCSIWDIFGVSVSSTPSSTGLSRIACFSVIRRGSTSGISTALGNVGVALSTSVEIVWGVMSFSLFSTIRCSAFRNLRIGWRSSVLSTSVVVFTTCFFEDDRQGAAS